MKKIFILLVVLITLVGCTSVGGQRINNEERYQGLIEMLNEYENYAEKSNNFNIALDIASINDGYRYYVTIDKPKIAMYDVEAIAIEKDVDYTNTMTASIGIFDESEYALVPNQKNTNKGYYEGIMMSGVSNSPEITLNVFVSYKNKDYSINHTEYIVLSGKYEEQ